ncbi:MAG: two-component sensor histidine kinase, partial [Homoserinimonas sp.]|nr:two-component sensor histidine kinase [Homoserinimonas sp.]
MTDSAPPRRAKRWSLRTRLVVSIVALLAAASVIVGLVSVLALQGFLMDRLDRQLTAATGRSEVAIDGDFGGELVPPVPGIGGDLPRVGVQGPFTITAEVYGGLILAGVINEEGYLEGLTPAQSRLLATVPADGEPATLSLGGRLGDYRVAANQFAGGRVVVTGLPLSDVQAVVMQLIVVVAVVTALVLAAAVVGGIVVVRAALRPLERVAATAAQVARLPLDRGEVALAVRVPDFDADPRTEVGQVGAAFNRMLGHVASALTARQASENKVRRFVADASHELRTPLASIRGYAELTRRGNHELPPDVVHSLGRVESEAKRMTSLVEDLLLLARLDEGQSLEREPVDLSLLLIDAVSDAHAAGPNHVWSLDLPERPVIVEGDRGRLHQVVVNLLA